MSAIAVLEARLRTHRDDEEGWLVYADWLSDKGDSRGALIALERRRARGGLSASEAAALDREIEALIEAGRPRWLGRTGGSDALDDIEWYNGFIWRVRLRGPSAVRVLERLLQPGVGNFLVTLELVNIPSASLSPLLSLLRESHVQTLRFGGIPARGPDVGIAIASVGSLGPVTALDLSRMRLGDEGVIALAASSSLEDLHSIDLGLNRIGPRGVRALVSAQLGSLRALFLADNPIGEAGARALVTSALARALVSLDLGGADLGDDGTATLGEGELADLVSLTLSQSGISAAGLRALVASRSLRSLRALVLSDNQLGDDGAALLSGWERSDVLLELDLSGNQISARGVSGLSSMRSLVSLTLSDNPLGISGALALARAELPSLTSLDLTSARIGPGVGAVTASSTLRSLRRLDLSDNGLQPSHVGALARGALFASLVSLSLARNHLGDEGIAALLASVPPRALEALDLSNNQIGPSGAQTLADARQLPALASLILDGNLIGDAGALALAASEGLPSLASLSVCINAIRSAGAAALASSLTLRALTTLDLSENPIHNFGIAARAPRGRRIIET